MNFLRLNLLLFGLLISTVVSAVNVEVTDAWARVTLPGQDDGMVSLTITSKQTVTLTGITSIACKSVEIHQMTHDHGMMKMREVNSIKLPAGKRINFEEDGYHLMLIGLKSPLKEGERVPLTLNIKPEKQSAVKVKALVEVRSLTTTQATD